MKPSKTSSIERVQEVTRFEAIKAKLLGKSFAQHLKKPLAHWAVKADKRLPLALMGRTLGEILNTPFDEISDTPGVGQKKIAGLVRLLARAMGTDPNDVPKGGEISSNGDGQSAVANSLASHTDVLPSTDRAPKPKAFSTAGISEIMWEKWRTCIVQHGFEGELFGRFAPRLCDVTKVIWTMPLETYTGYTLEQLRNKKTHGEKRVRAILETFHAVYSMIAAVGTQPHLTVRIVPRRIDMVEHWIAQTLQSLTLPDEKTLFENFTGPLLEQIHDDASEQIAALADVRLGVVRRGATVEAKGRSMSSVREIAHDLKVTRARVYQLLNEINEIFAVRWPTGRHQVYELRHRLLSDAERLEPTRDMRQFKAAIELFYPGPRRGANGPAATSALAKDDDDDDAHDADGFRDREIKSDLVGLSV